MESQTPNFWRTTSFFVRSKSLKFHRLLKDYSQPARSLGRTADLYPLVLSESVTLLRYVQRPAEQIFEEGKIKNLQIACGHITGIFLEPGQVFSFWKSVGPPWKRRGFAMGREIREGCLVPTIGGGLCQISGALHSVATKAGLSILERHAHTRRLQESYFDESHDATLFWNYVDLRFSSSFKIQIEAFLTEYHLVVRLRAMEEPIKRQDEGTYKEKHLDKLSLKEVSDCLSCGQYQCSENKKTLRMQPHRGSQLVLSEKLSPEFDSFLRNELKPEEFLIKTFPWANFKRSIVSRFGARHQVAAWVRIAGARIIADVYAKEIRKTKSDHLFDHLFIDQEILPFLWQRGVLKNRKFSVLASRLPISAIEQKLDEQLEKHPSRKSLAEFRVSKELAKAEEHAFYAAHRIISAHEEVVRLIPRSEKINWLRPNISNLVLPSTSRDLYLFPAITAAREGAYEVRAAARQLGLRLAVFPQNIEDAQFWEGIEVLHCTSDSIPWNRIIAVLHPVCFLAHPSLHLKALAFGIPVIASVGCGLPPDQIISIEVGSSQDLILKIKTKNVISIVSSSHQ